MKAPAFLKPGDMVAIVSPAGALRDTAIVDGAVKTLESWGLETIVAEHALTNNGYYSGTAEERIKDISDCLSNEKIKALLCSYGGYGCVHIADEFAQLISEHPKWIIGMSDCSVLHAVCIAQGVMSIHSPQCRHLAQMPESAPARMLRDILFGKFPAYHVQHNSLDTEGIATGMLAGGNLSVITALAGTRYDMFREETILFIEDTGEQPYRIERMMYQLELSGALSKIKGIIVGEFNGTKEDLRFGGTTHELIAGVVKKHGIPACFGFPVGHCNENYPLIEGATVTLTVNKNGTSLEYPTVIR